MRWDDGTRRPKSWDAPAWLRGSVLVQVYHISVLQQNEYCYEKAQIKSSGLGLIEISNRLSTFSEKWDFYKPEF